MIWVLVLLACGESYLLSDEQRAEIEKVGAEARAAGRARDDVRRNTLLLAKGTVGPRPDLGRCPIVPAPPTPDEVCMSSDGGLAVNFSVTPVNIVRAEHLAKVEGPRYDRLDNGLAIEVESLLFHTFSTGDPTYIGKKMDRLRELASEGFWTPDGTLVVDDERAPVPGTDSFEPGLISGRLYVWDYDKKQIVCAATVRATNSDQLGVRKHTPGPGVTIAAQSDLLCDLYKQGVRDGYEDLWLAGPPVFEATLAPATP